MKIIPCQLLKLQKRALRFIYFSDHNQHAIPLFTDIGVLLLQFSYYELTANLMFDIKHRNAPCSIQELFQDISEILSHNTWSSASNNKVPNYQFDYILSPELKPKFEMRCP